MSGKVKHTPDPMQALWVPVSCNVCKGSGTVPTDQVKEIEKSL